MAANATLDHVPYVESGLPSVDRVRDAMPEGALRSCSIGLAKSVPEPRTRESKTRARMEHPRFTAIHATVPNFGVAREELLAQLVPLSTGKWDDPAKSSAIVHLCSDAMELLDADFKSLCPEQCDVQVSLRLRGGETPPARCRCRSTKRRG